MADTPKKSLKEVFDEAEREIELWPDWKKALLKRAREIDAYWSHQSLLGAILKKEHPE